MIRILIVEDELPIANLIRLSLSKAGYTCDCVYDGAAAADQIAAQSYDLILLDVMLPEVDGFTLLEYIRPYEIPVIFLTAKNAVQDRVKGLRLGAEDYIVKPFEVLELLVRIEKILERTGRLNKIIRYRDIEINTSTRTVRLRGDAVVLQPIEYDLLITLIRHKNCTLSRESLLSDVWGFEYMGTTRTVDTHISALRRKLGLGDAIASIPKVGYRLEGD